MKSAVTPQALCRTGNNWSASQPMVVNKQQNKTAQWIDYLTKKELEKHQISASGELETCSAITFLPLKDHPMKQGLALFPAQFYSCHCKLSLLHFLGIKSTTNWGACHPPTMPKLAIMPSQDPYPSFPLENHPSLAGQLCWSRRDSSCKQQPSSLHFWLPGQKHAGDNPEQVEGDQQRGKLQQEHTAAT